MFERKWNRLECPARLDVVEVIVLQPEKRDADRSDYTLPVENPEKRPTQRYKVLVAAVPEKVPHPASDDLQAREDRDHDPPVEEMSLLESQNYLHPCESQYPIQNLQNLMAKTELAAYFILLCCAST